MQEFNAFPLMPVYSVKFSLEVFLKVCKYALVPFKVK